VSLVAFDSCDGAVAELRRAAEPYVFAYGFGWGGRMAVDLPLGAAEDSQRAAPVPGAAKTAAPEHSTTNNHEVGVDEPDLVKTDGKRIVTIADGKLRVVDVASRKVTGTLELTGGFPTQLLLEGDRALVVLSSPMMKLEKPTGFAPPEDGIGGSSFALVDLSGAPRVLSTLTVDGGYVDARQIGGTARVVVRSSPRLPFVYPTNGRTEDEAVQQNKTILNTAPIQDWLPRYELTTPAGSSKGTVVECDRVSHPEVHSGTSMLTVLTMNLGADLSTRDAVSIVADGDTVYGTGSSLYIADDHHLVALPSDTQGRVPAPPQPSTAIHQFDISQPGPPQHVASGTVAGALLNQYSLSEFAGHLRVATTNTTATGSQSAVTVLTRQGNTFAETGKVDGLGVGERIFSVRLIGPVGYVVTFRQTDPLYTLDLSDPAKPRVVGELKITGYSAYLHPAGDGKLIGVGQEATDRGRTTGTQVSLFDVANPASPQRVAQQLLPGSNSEVEYDPHAFLYWPAKGLLVVPVMSDYGAGGALVLHLGDAGFTELGTVRHPGDAVRRAIVIGDDLWTISSTGLMVTTPEAGVAQEAWVPFA
jgi:uncharacterized secreted protein with C-terminal beta-propeller domain